MVARNETDDDRVLVITRVFDAPRELVFRAGTETANVKPSTTTAQHGYRLDRPFDQLEA
jgi:uncharacterized protein YndB with AHSA1/START domain